MHATILGTIVTLLEKLITDRETQIDLHRQYYNSCGANLAVEHEAAALREDRRLIEQIKRYCDEANARLSRAIR